MEQFPKIFTLAPNENWICDRFVEEWTNFYQFSVSSPEDADIIWCLADWAWDKIPQKILQQKIVVATVHHIVPEKFDKNQQEEFLFRDSFVDFYHVPCEKTRQQIECRTDKVVFVQPFWVDGNLWKQINETKSEQKKNIGIDPDCFLVGSFQRDTEGNDLISPKLEKGPDIFCDAVELLHKTKMQEGIEVRVLLAGWRRQYVMNRLQAAGIKFYYCELPDSQTLNKLYNCLDLYIVSARYEGGPQAIVECAASNTPIISTDVGIAKYILEKESIFDKSLDNFLIAKPNIEIALLSVSQYLMPLGFSEFVKFFKYAGTRYEK